MIKEFQQVVLTEDLPKSQLKAGDLGIVVMIHGKHLGYELEIFSAEGRTLDVVTVTAEQIRPITTFDLLHVRQSQPLSSTW
jgi:hypothetical protein